MRITHDDSIEVDAKRHPALPCSASRRSVSHRRPGPIASQPGVGATTTVTEDIGGQESTPMQPAVAVFVDYQRLMTGGTPRTLSDVCRTASFPEFTAIYQRSGGLTLSHGPGLLLGVSPHKTSHS